MKAPVHWCMIKAAYSSSPVHVCSQQSVRCFGTTGRNRRHDSTRRVVSFPGFQDDAMNAPFIFSQPLTPQQPVLLIPKDAGRSEMEERIAKAKIIFGTRLSGPVQRRRAIESASTIIAGVSVPPKPEEPDNCCMSGCANCVWDQFRDEIEEWAAKSAEAKARLQEQRSQKYLQSNLTVGDAALNSTASSMDDDGGGSDTSWSQSESTDLFADIPIGIREFMKTEKKLKERLRKDKAVVV